MQDQELLQKLVENQSTINNLLLQVSALLADQKQNSSTQVQMEQANDKQLKQIKHPLTINQIFTIIAGVSSLISVVINFLHSH